MTDQEEFGIDIMKYIEPLFRQWRIILIFTLIFAVGSAIYSIRQPDMYTAKVLVASSNVASNVSLGSGIETLTEEQQGYRLGGSTERLQSYVHMVKNPIIAQQVIDEIGKKLPENLQEIPNLIARVKGGVASKSDSIEILVTHGNPQVAENIANAWGIAYVDLVNSIYSSDASRGSYETIQRQKQQAWKSYTKAQSELEKFISDNQIDQLNRQITEHQSLINNLSAARNIAASTIISNTISAQLTISSENLSDLENRLINAYQDSRRVEQLLADASDMRKQVVIGGDAAARSNSLALTLIKVQVFTVSGEDLTRYEIQLSPTEITVEEMVADLDGLTEILETRLIDLNSEIEELSNQLLELKGMPGSMSQGSSNTGDQASNDDVDMLEALLELQGLVNILSASKGEDPLGEQMTQLEDDLNQLQAQAASETDREQELIRARDLAWSTYSNLATKEAELTISTGPLGAEVSLAVPASTPKATSSNLLENTLLGALIGLVVGIGVSYIVEFWWLHKGVQPKPVKFFGL